MGLKNKNIQISGKTYLISQVPAIEAIAMTPLVKRLEVSLTALDSGEVPNIDEKQLKRDLDNFFFDSSYLKLFTGTDKESGINKYKKIMSNGELPSSITGIIELMTTTMGHIYATESDQPLGGDGGEEEGKLEG